MVDLILQNKLMIIAEVQKRKILFVANIAKHILRFHLPYLKWLQDNGFETHVAAHGDEPIPYCDVQHNVPIERSPFSLKNLHAHKVLKKIIEDNNFALVHGHTPMGGVLTRTASASSRKNGTKVLYTAHGFHFFKGAPLKNWLLYYPMEKYLASYTDGIVTINTEDFNLLFEKKFNTPSKFNIKGIGVDAHKFKPVSSIKKSELRKQLGYNDKQFILIYVGEFIYRKNHRFIIDSANTLAQRIPNLKIIFAGRGALIEEMKNYAIRQNVNEFIDFLGFRTDIQDLMSISDIGVSSSRHEGLPINLVEEMFCGLPVIATQDRGHRDLIYPGENGFLFNQSKKVEFIFAITDLYSNPEKRIKFGNKSIELAQKFTLENSLKSMADIYSYFLNK